jgi:hypothetical protein
VEREAGSERLRMVRFERRQSAAGRTDGGGE